MHPVEKKPAVEVAFGMLHAGGKFSRSGADVYHISGGLHGVGVAVSNALSKRLDVTVYRDGQKHTIAFEGGDRRRPPSPASPPGAGGGARRRRAGGTSAAWRSTSTSCSPGASSWRRSS